ncbi:MAG: replicative DNA helicase [Fibrobacterota bacterium]
MKKPEKRKVNEQLQPPQALDIERHLLGTALKDKDAFNSTIEVIREPEIFYREAHKLIFKAMLELEEKNENIDILTVSELLKKTGDLEKAGGTEYLMELAADVIFSGNIESHARIVREKSILRDLITISRKAIGNAFEQSEEVSIILNNIEQEIFRLAQRQIKKDFTKISNEINPLLNQIQMLSDNKDSTLGIPTGYNKLDSLIGGFHKTDLIIIAGRPGSGKTSFALSLASNMAMKLENPVPCAVFSLEMSNIQLVKRIVCAEAKINMNKLNTGNLATRDLQKIAMATSPMANAPIWLDDTPGISVMEIRAKARRLKARNDIGIIFVDYLQLVTGGARFESRQIEIQYISSALKSIAKELDIPVVALSQLNRSVEQRSKDARPQLSDLRESGSIEQDADMVMFVHNDKSENDMTSGDSIKSSIILEKNRNGPTGDIPVTFIKKFTRFENFEPMEPEETVY